MVIEFDDVGVVGHGDDFGFPEEMVDHLGVVEVGGGEDFDDARLMGLGVESEVEEAHAPFGQEGLDFVGADFLGDGDGAVLFFERRECFLLIKLLLPVCHLIP